MFLAYVKEFNIHGCSSSLCRQDPVEIYKINLDTELGLESETKISSDKNSLSRLGLIYLYYRNLDGIHLLEDIKPLRSDSIQIDLEFLRTKPLRFQPMTCVCDALQVAMEAADMVLVRSDVCDVVSALHLGRKVCDVHLNPVEA